MTIKAQNILLIYNQVKLIYDWLDNNIKSLNNECSACGKCCNFESFGHKLFITSPELLYFSENLNLLRKMTGGCCPYLEDNKCTTRDFRFAGCRIFFCKADSQKLSELSEQTIHKFKKLCDNYNFHYRYIELSAALNHLD